uniref:Ig-like domain-containing protein n=1 Tax=Lates calcarifer TaxID=8187 RepID=A0A4W6D4Y1_LATCA
RVMVELQQSLNRFCLFSLLLLVQFHWRVGVGSPIIALAGDDVILPCHLEPVTSAASWTVEWTKPGLDPEFVHVHEDGRLLHEIQNPSYYYRTRLFVDELEHGNVSMKIFEVKLSDEGTYRCSLPVVQEEVFVQLIVGKLVQNSESLRKSVNYLFRNNTIFKNVVPTAGPEAIV